MKIKGTKKDDVLVGTNGDDLIKGRKGDDVLIGTGGADKMKGGRGADIFVVNDDDRILDFKQGVDKIVVDRPIDDVIHFSEGSLYATATPDGDVGETYSDLIVTVDGLESLLPGDILSA